MATTLSDEASIRSAVRRNAIWAAGAAVIMLYYGVYQGLGRQPSELDPDRIRWGGWVVLYTLRIGGGLMALSTLLSLMGVRPALLFDGFASMSIGLCLALAGGLLLADMGLRPVLLLMFAALFVYTGYRNWREYNELMTGPGGDSVTDSPGEAA